MLFIAISITSVSAHELRIESAIIDFSRNEIAIPGDSGNLFNTADDDWKQHNSFAYRLYYTHKLDEQSSLRFLFAPLQTQFTGRFDNITNFNGQNFMSGDAKVNYKFNSYRIGYHRQLMKKDQLVLNYGLVAKIRDAEIEVIQGSQSSSRKDLGLVPLLHFDINYNFYKDVSLYFDLDGLIAPQGRAFDGGLFIQREYKQYKVFAGYRFLEGGADNDKVKTFSYVNYYTLGMSFNF